MDRRDGLEEFFRFTFGNQCPGVAQIRSPIVIQVIEPSLNSRRDQTSFGLQAASQHVEIMGSGARRQLPADLTPFSCRSPLKNEGLQSALHHIAAEIDCVKE